MKGGFLLPNQSATATSAGKVDQPPTNDVRDVVVHSVAYVLDPKDNSYGYKARVSPATFDHSSLPSDKTLCTRIPPSPIDSYAPCECLMSINTLRRLYETPNYPCPPPAVPASQMYELRPRDSSTTRGMFAMQSLKIGDLILVERPIVLICSNPVAVSGISWFDSPEMQIPGRFEWKSTAVFYAILEVLFNRMSKEDQAAYMALPNVHKDEPPLVGIYKTNNVMMRKLELGDHGYTYSGMFRLMPRIHHSCEPNAAHSFDPASFSIQIRATRPILQGEEISITYCETTIPTSQRRAWLSALGITCTCASCVCNPSVPRNDTIRCSIPNRLRELFDLRVAAEPSNSLMYATTFATGGLSAAQTEQLRKHHLLALELQVKARKLMDDMIAEGMDGCEYYFEALEVLSHAVMQLSCTSKFDPSLKGSPEKAQWEWDIRRLATETVMLHNAHYGTFKKHQFEVLFLPHGLLDLPE